MGKAKGNNTAERAATKQPVRRMIKVYYRTETGRLKWRMEDYSGESSKK